MSNEMYIEIDSGAKAIFVNPKTKKTMYQLMDCNKHYAINHVRKNAEEYCSIKRIDSGLLYCDFAINIIENNLSKLNMTKTMEKEFAIIRKFIQEQLENNPIKGSKNDEFIIKEQFYQCVSIYEKEKNPFKDSN